MTLSNVKILPLAGMLNRQYPILEIVVEIDTAMIWSRDDCMLYFSRSDPFATRISPSYNALPLPTRTLGSSAFHCIQKNLSGMGNWKYVISVCVHDVSSYCISFK